MLPGEVWQVSGGVGQCEGLLTTGCRWRCYQIANSTLPPAFRFAAWRAWLPRTRNVPEPKCYIVGLIKPCATCARFRSN